MARRCCQQGAGDRSKRTGQLSPSEATMEEHGDEARKDSLSTLLSCSLTCFTSTNDFVSKHTLTSLYNVHIWFDLRAHLASSSLEPLAVRAAPGTETAALTCQRTRHAASHTSSTCPDPSSITSTHPHPTPTHATPSVRPHFFGRKLARTHARKKVRTHATFTPSRLYQYNWESMSASVGSFQGDEVFTRQPRLHLKRTSCAPKVQAVPRVSSTIQSACQKAG